MGRDFNHVIELGTKAETLDRLSAHVTTARILPQVRFTVEAWRTDGAAVLQQVGRLGEGPLIVRSSARAEDATGRSQAGRFTSVRQVLAATLPEAIEKVVASYGAADPDDQVFVQPQLVAVRLAGVAFSCDPGSGAPYIVISYSDSGSTDAVTSGRSSDIRTCYCHRSVAPESPSLARVAALVREVELALQADAVDVEFAIDEQDELYLFQARPLRSAPLPDEATHADVVREIERKVGEGMQPHPHLLGRRTVYGVMPDWNPAEIIGVRPRPLALSLYKEIMTDSIWAYQRNNYGYKNLRSFPLLLSFAGLPYIDVRVSFNSFIPADLDADLAERLVNDYVDRLIESPHDHDKVEFEIIYSCYTLDLPERLQLLRTRGFSEADCRQVADSLRRLTNRIIHGERGLWRQDLAKVDQLDERRQRILDSSLPVVGKIYWLLEDCKRYGTLPFAGLARAGFIAVQMLQSLVAVRVLSDADYQRFMASLETVSWRMTRDFASLDRNRFLEHYGHLRPGTYDILSPRYDEEPDRYFDWDTPTTEPPPRDFLLSLPQLNEASRLLGEHGIEHSGIGLFNFIKAAIEGRESSKFVFTRSLSDALRLIGELGEEFGLSREDCSYADIAAIYRLQGTSDVVRDAFLRSVEAGRRAHATTSRLVLPPLVVNPADVWQFEMPAAEPNYITLGRANGAVRSVDAGRDALAGCILFIPSADPGFDWIFAHGIAGFVTMYGGANSHMAIRAGEMGIPAVIGVGEVLFQRWASASRVELDCANRQVRILR